MVAEEVLTYGLVERRAWLFANVSVMTAVCAWTAWTVAAWTNRLVWTWRHEILTCTCSTLWLRACGKPWNSLRCARARSLQRSAYDCRMLRWSSKLRQSVPKSPSEPLTLRSGERWLVLEMLLEVDLSFRLRVAEFMVTVSVRETRCLRSFCRKSQLNMPLTTQQIADFKDQLFNRALTKDLQGNEQ